MKEIIPTSLQEVSRRDLVMKSRLQSRPRFQKRLNYQVTNFRGVDLEQLFENDYFVFSTPIGNYICTVAFPGVFTELKNVVRSTGGDPTKITLQMVIRALRIAFDATDDVKVRCSCADFTYRFMHWADRNGYLYGPPTPGTQAPPDIRNPNNSIGSTCKHLDLLLSNKQWLVKAASVVNAFIKAYPDKASMYLYDTYSAPIRDDEVEDEYGEDEIEISSPETDRFEVEIDDDDENDDLIGDDLIGDDLIGEEE